MKGYQTMELNRRSASDAEIEMTRSPSHFELNSLPLLGALRVSFSLSVHVAFWAAALKGVMHCRIKGVCPSICLHVCLSICPCARPSPPTDCSSAPPPLNLDGWAGRHADRRTDDRCTHKFPLYSTRLQPLCSHCPANFLTAITI